MLSIIPSKWTKVTSNVVLLSFHNNSVLRIVPTSTQLSVWRVYLPGRNTSKMSYDVDVRGCRSHTSFFREQAVRVYQLQIQMCACLGILAMFVGKLRPSSRQKQKHLNLTHVCSWYFISVPSSFKRRSLF